MFRTKTSLNSFRFDDTPDPITTTSDPSSTQLSAPSGTPSSDSDEGRSKPPLGGIIGGTIGGLAVILGVILLLCIFRDKKNRRKSPELPLHRNSTARHATASRGGRPQDLINFTGNVQPRPFWRTSDKTPPHRPMNPPGPPLIESESISDNFETESGAISTNPQPISSAYTATRRARQLQLEGQLRAAEQELREMGIEPHRGPPGPNVPPAMLETSVYIEYRRLQGEMEEPPPQYSESG